MVGEGMEADEDEDYPRSFKNKTVGQRMLIISAGVVMNVLLGCILFIVVYYYHGVEQAARHRRPGRCRFADVGEWRSHRLAHHRLDGIRNPVFKNLQPQGHSLQRRREVAVHVPDVRRRRRRNRIGERSICCRAWKRTIRTRSSACCRPISCGCTPRPKKDIGLCP